MNLRNHNWRDVYKVLVKRGFYVGRQRGDHIQLIHNDGKFVTLVKHNPIKIGTLKSILIQADISQEEFIKEI